MRRLELIPLALLLAGGIALAADITSPSRDRPAVRGGVEERSDRAAARKCPAGCLCPITGDHSQCLDNCECLTSADIRTRRAIICPPGCLADQDLAIERSQRSGRPVFFWVNLSPADAPRFAAGLDPCDPIHCCLSSNNGDSTPRVIMLSPHASRGVTWKAAALNAGTAGIAVAAHDQQARPRAFAPPPTFAPGPQYFMPPAGYGAAGGNCPGGVCPPGR